MGALQVDQGQQGLPLVAFSLSLDRSVAAAAAGLHVAASWLAESRVSNFNLLSLLLRAD